MSYGSRSRPTPPVPVAAPLSRRSAPYIPGCFGASLPPVGCLASLPLGAPTNEGGGGGQIFGGRPQSTRLKIILTGVIGGGHTPLSDS